ncbi:MAG: hypothetical protein H6Q32_912 [Bacteroidetes bacterium]|nr:hypothetical protein [Bacteroidota bacterium]
MRNPLAVATLMVCALLRSAAQPPTPADAQLPVYLEALVLPSPDSSAWLAILNYRIDRDFFIPVRTNDAAAEGQFRRTGEILMELTDSTDAPAGRQFRRVDLAEAALSPPTLERRWLQGTASFVVPEGTHRVFFEATDAESRRRQANRETIIRTPRRPLGAAIISGAAFIAPPDPHAPDSLLFENLGGDFLFGKGRSLLVGLRLSDDTSTTARYRFTFTLRSHNKEDERIQASDSGRSLPIIRRSQIAMCESCTEVRGVVHAPGPEASSFVVIPLPTALLPLRDYTMQVDVTTAAGTRATLSRPVRALWPEMPFSLKDVDGALDALRIITSPRQLDSLRSGSFEQKRDALEAFWQSRNPNAGTARNEVMAEYYRRVDYAIRNFGTIRVPDGSRSDRGKIYILYGAASRTERALNPAGAHMETWIYERLKKRFIFVDEDRNGTYSLVTTTSQ